MPESTSSPSEDFPEHRWRALTGLCLAAALVWLAFADFAVVIPTIAREIAVSLPQLQWANNAFGLAAGALVIAAGRIGDMHGQRRTLQAGLAVFGVSSLLVLILPGSTGPLITRALMGIGAAFILPPTLALIPVLFPPAERPRAFGAWMAIAWGGQGAAPVVGGLLNDALGWMSVFWINAPLVLVAVYLVRRYTVEAVDRTASRHIDVAGLATSALACFCLIYGCTIGQEDGFTDPFVIGVLILSVVAGVAFVLLQKHLSDPLVDLRLFSYRPFRGALAANTVMNAVFAGISFLLALYAQNVRGESALTAGLLLLPAAVTALLFNPLGGLLSARTTLRLPVVLGILIMGAGTLLTALLGRDAPTTVISAGLLVFGTGLGLMSVPLARAAVSEVPIALAGTASGLFKATSMLGGALGVAALTTLQRMFEGLDALHRAQAAGLSEEQAETLSKAATDSKLAAQVLSSVDAATAQSIRQAYHEVETRATGEALFVTGIVTLVAALALPLVWRQGRKREKR